MDVIGEIEKKYKIPRIFIAILAIIFGILILFEPQILNILVAIFLLVWGILEAVRAGSTTTRPQA